MAFKLRLEFYAIIYIYNYNNFYLINNVEWIIFLISLILSLNIGFSLNHLIFSGDGWGRIIVNLCFI